MATFVKVTIESDEEPKGLPRFVNLDRVLDMRWTPAKRRTTLEFPGKYLRAFETPEEILSRVQQRADSDLRLALARAARNGGADG